MVNFTAIRRVRTYKEIVDQICGGINAGEIVPGEKLPAERALAVQFGTGRQCLREALSVLEMLGIIEVRKGRGTYITGEAPQRLLSAQLPEEELGDPFELMEARRHLEPKVAFLAAKRGDPATILALEGIIREMADTLSLGRHATEEDRRLHMTIAVGCGNKVLAKMVNELITGMHKPLWTGFKERSLLVSGRDERYFVEHSAIVKAIKDQSAAEASRLMKQHLNGVAQDVLK